MTRPRLQLHLATCVVLLFTAAGLLALNLSERWKYAQHFDVLPHDGDLRWQGWPLDGITRRTRTAFEIHTKPREYFPPNFDQNGYAPREGYPWRPPEATRSHTLDFPVLNTQEHIHWHAPALAANALLALLILVAVAVLCEKILFRRPAENPRSEVPNPPSPEAP